jgi:hypothetical protein
MSDGMARETKVPPNDSDILPEKMINELLEEHVTNPIARMLIIRHMIASERRAYLKGKASER